MQNDPALVLEHVTLLNLLVDSPMSKVTIFAVMLSMVHHFRANTNDALHSRVKSIGSIMTQENVLGMILDLIKIVFK